MGLSGARRRAYALRPMLTVADEFREAFPGAVVGALALGGVRNPERSDALEDAKRALEAELRGAPAGIGEKAVRRHLDDLRANVELIAPDARTEALVVV